MKARREGEERTKGVLGLGVLDKGGVGSSVDEGSGQRVAPLFYSDGSGGRGRGGRRGRGRGREGRVVGEKRAAKSVAGSGIEMEEDRGWVRCGPRSTDSSWSYAPDGQGRYTTTMYFR